jgi:Flp pilus assembly pilin Flp
VKTILASLLTYKRQPVAATGIEYALMAAGISLTIMGAVFFFGGTIAETFTLMFTTMATYLQEG